MGEPSPAREDPSSVNFVVFKRTGLISSVAEPRMDSGGMKLSHPFGTICDGALANVGFLLLRPESPSPFCGVSLLAGST